MTHEEFTDRSIDNMYTPHKQTRAEKKWLNDYFGTTERKKKFRFNVVFNYDHILLRNKPYPVCVDFIKKHSVETNSQDMLHYYSITNA